LIEGLTTPLYDYVKIYCISDLLLKFYIIQHDILLQPHFEK